MRYAAGPQLGQQMHFHRVKRREFITLLGGAAAGLPQMAHAQQTTMPVIGYLHSQSPDAFRDALRGFRQGLREAGYTEGENLAVEYRFADNQMDQLSELAADLVRRRVAVIVTGGGPAPTFAAKSATATIPILFAAIADDPVKLGLVASLARPGGNVTGINALLTESATKRLELLREMVPAMTRVAALVNPTEASNTEATLKDLETAARLMGLEIKPLKASTSSEINAAFATLEAERGAIFVAPDSFFTTRRVQLVLLAMLHRIPVIYPTRPFTEAGGLMSYGTSLTDAYRQAGDYTGRILKGAKPADLPVARATKFELIINASTSGMLGLTVPDKLLVAADEVIE
jgi:putative ABC transport system substrate-binding protein